MSSQEGPADKNYPFATYLLAADKRPHVAALYAFARVGDNIVDDPELDTEEKLLRIEAMERGLSGSTNGSTKATVPEAALRMHDSLQKSGVSDECCHKLLAAFRQDTVNAPCQSWQDLLDYCALAAVPIGRYLIELHNLDSRRWAFADPFCHALQILNCVQGCGDDWRSLHRLYLPETWLTEAGETPESLAATSASPALRSVIDRCLDGVDDFIHAARQGRRYATGTLGLEAGGMLGITGALATHLRNHDPLAGHMALSRSKSIVATASGVLGVLPWVLRNTTIRAPRPAGNT